MRLPGGKGERPATAPGGGWRPVAGRNRRPAEEAPAQEASDPPAFEARAASVPASEQGPQR